MLCLRLIIKDKIYIKLHQLFIVFITLASIRIYMCTLYIGAYTNVHTILSRVYVLLEQAEAEPSL